MHWLIAIWGWIEHLTGMHNESGPNYAFFSSWGPGISTITLMGGIYGLYRAHQCHTDGCKWIGKYNVEGTPYRVCHRCHPLVPSGGASKEHIHAVHKAAQMGGMA